MKSKDPRVKFAYEFTEEVKFTNLERVLIITGQMAHNFDLYSDVVFMDATYAVNPHRMPLIIFTGINCEGKNCVLGYALVRRETKETYVWLLKQFVLLQRGNAPQVILTDFDPSMSSAIEAVMPDTTHLLC
jgi:hypothetical protein